MIIRLKYKRQFDRQFIWISRKTRLAYQDVLNEVGPGDVAFLNCTGCLIITVPTSRLTYNIVVGQHGTDNLLEDWRRLASKFWLVL